jgi:hypothetical protein
MSLCSCGEIRSICAICSLEYCSECALDIHKLICLPDTTENAISKRIQRLLLNIENGNINVIDDRPKHYLRTISMYCYVYFNHLKYIIIKN